MPSARARRWSKTKNSATTPPWDATWQTTRTSKTRPRCGMKREGEYEVSRDVCSLAQQLHACGLRSVPIERHRLIAAHRMTGTHNQAVFKISITFCVNAQ